MNHIYYLNLINIINMTKVILSLFLTFINIIELHSFIEVCKILIILFLNLNQSQNEKFISVYLLNILFITIN